MFPREGTVCASTSAEGSGVFLSEEIQRQSEQSDRSPQSGQQTRFVGKL